ncbi:hypothetical protein N474_20770 [Pseudoalteromonas luteoviolacea CPMOR-2]|uniref:Uncharacterized protein n=1 Tax=Pseudoalteromonas luteoviolacea DSM 6061 TaxID=1365250 RepID=A0A166W3L4_9GAMM|nr:hypothetical protein [Pseudoalteromonas luteoviolacea]KZN35373.1 hypothetical protein N475_18700 [Pseudoalteromonas luteoviolacea DSM 6061]KZN53494.1 hypothetical protein N474_20770 [Pseudoalteromonas luteoviolacea CPMOR-2]MBE0387618.1 hypothetical protein [Pseudoalteromonas luteoviolacea DSM 6061]
MVAWFGYVLIGFLLFSQSKYWPYAQVPLFNRLFALVTTTQVLVVSIVLLTVIYYLQMGFIAAIFLVLFAISIGLPVVVMMGHHRGTAPVLMLLTLAAIGGVL